MSIQTCTTRSQTADTCTREVQACVCGRRTLLQIQHKHTQMFNALHVRWSGHLPLVILYAPSASIWALKPSLLTLLALWLWRKAPQKSSTCHCLREQLLTHTRPFPAQSCSVCTMCVVLAVSLLLLSTCLWYLQRSRPLFRKCAVWLRLLYVAAPIEINCLACMIQTGIFRS